MNSYATNMARLISSTDRDCCSELHGSNPRIAVVVATINRPCVLAETLRRILHWQTYAAEMIVVSCADIKEAESVVGWPNVLVIKSVPGLAAQRNAALEALPEYIDIVAFFDDDFVPDPDWLKIAAKWFDAEQDLVGLTGWVVADGIKGPGLTFEEADVLIDGFKDAFVRRRIIEPFSPYGCNMAFRRSSIKTLRFDERLVLYGWLEDRDFGAAVAVGGGRVVKCMEARGVHLGVKSGRIAGFRLGYSQIINPIYLLKKGTMSPAGSVAQILKNVASNIIGSIWPERYIDRRGRLHGNILGFIHALTGRIDPTQAASMPPER